MIVFGGLVFWLIILVIIIGEAIALSTKSEGFCLLLGIGAVLLFAFGLDVRPTLGFDPKLLLLYPILAVVWCPIYWYLALKRRAKEVKSMGGLLEAYAKSSKVIKTREYDENSEPVVTYKLKHPPADEIVANSILFPISVPVSLLDEIIQKSIKFLATFMNRVRDNISKSI